MTKPTVKLKGKLITNAFIFGTALATSPRAAIVNKRATSIGAANSMAIDKIPLVNLINNIVKGPLKCAAPPGISWKVSAIAVKKMWCKLRVRNISITSIR